jgi:putative transposase
MKPTMKKKAAYHKPYEEEYKRQAVDLVIRSGKTCEQVARELGCSAYSLHLWKRQYLAEMAPREGEDRTMSAEGLERENRALRKQVQYLERQREILKKSYQHTGRGTQSRYALIEELSMEFGIQDCCEALGVSRSGYYKWQQPEAGPRAQANRALGERIGAVFEAHKGRYGSPRVTRALRAAAKTGWRASCASGSCRRGPEPD